MNPARWATTRDVWVKHPGYRLAHAVNVMMAAYLGITGLTMDGRFTAPTFDSLRESLTVPGWGALLCSVSVALVVGAWAPARVMMGVFAFSGVAYLLLGIWFAAGMNNPLASPWGPVFLFIGVWQMTQAEAYRQSVQH